MVAIRPASNKDSFEILNIFKEVLDEFDLPFVIGESNYDIDDIDKHYQKPGAFFVVVSKQEIIGTIGILAESSVECELTKLYLRKEFRGEGLGLMMLNYALTYACSMGFSKVHLITNSKLKKAVQLFRSKGFKEIPNPIQIPTACNLSMELSLNAANIK